MKELLYLTICLFICGAGESIGDSLANQIGEYHECEIPNKQKYSCIRSGSTK